MMQIKCPQHKIPLEIEERDLEVLGVVYPSAIGKCPSCKTKYINRMIFPACNTINVAGESYQYVDALNKLYSPKEQMNVQEEAESEHFADISSAKKEKQAKNNIEQKKEPKKNDKKHIRIENPAVKIKFVEHVPNFCLSDGDRLSNKTRVSFELFGVEIRTSAHYCIRCNCAYIPQWKKKEWKKQAKKLKENNVISSKKLEKEDNKAIPRESQTETAQKSFKVEYVLQRIPFLTSNSTYCPFCGKLLDQITGVKYYSFSPNGEKKQHHGAVNGCKNCKAIYANSYALEHMNKTHWGHTIHTVNPSDYSNAVEMMEATKITKHQESKIDLPLPFEDKINGAENISRERKIVQVYANKCHCQKCENKYKRVTTVNRTAVVDTLDGSTANINVMFCKGCGQYFVSIVTLEQYKTIYGGILMECKVSHDFSPNQYSWFYFAPDSVLSRCGYTVKESVSRDYRHAILRYILETGKATKHEIIEKINSFISFRDNQPKYEGACQRWREDIKFVSEYKIHKQKKVYGLEFKPSKSLQKSN